MFQAPLLGYAQFHLSCVVSPTHPTKRNQTFKISITIVSRFEKALKRALCSDSLQDFGVLPPKSFVSSTNDERRTRSPLLAMHDTEPRFLHISDIQKRPGFLTRWERHRHGSAHWIVECVAEFVSSTALFHRRSLTDDVVLRRSACFSTFTWVRRSLFWKPSLKN